MKSIDVLNYILAIGLILVIGLISVVLYEILKTIRAIKDLAEIVLESALETKWNVGKFIRMVFPFMNLIRRG